jgi:DNA-directed RNA polymerase specialized sigma24 family protein
MVAASSFAVSERSSPQAADLLISTEAAFRDALTDSLEGLELCDRNLLVFHHRHGLGVDQLADMFCSHRGAVVRQLARIRERVLRDTGRGLAMRLRADKQQIAHLIDLARGRLDLAISRVLRS